VQELRNLRDLHPRKLLGNTLLGNDGASAGGIAGFLGLDPTLLGPPTPGAEAGEATADVNGSAVQIAELNGSGGNGSALDPAFVAAPPAPVPPPAVPLAPGEHPPFDLDGT